MEKQQTPTIETLSKSAEMDFSVETYTDITEFKDLENQWESLFKRSLERFPMISHSWLSAWWQEFGEDHKLFIVTIWQGDNLALAAPLCFKQTKLLKQDSTILQFIMNERVDRMQVLFDEKLFNDDTTRLQLLKLFFDFLELQTPKWDLLRLKNMESQSPISKAIKTYLTKNKKKFGIEPGLKSPYLVIPNTWDDLLGGLSSSYRQSLRRKLRKGRKNDQITMQIYRDASVLDPIMKISKFTWQHENGTCMGSQPHIRRFYERIIKDAEKADTLYCAVLSVENEPVAFEFNLLCDSTLHNFKLGFHKDFANLSPGPLLKSFIFQSLLEKDKQLSIREYDFMGSSGQYKLNWSRQIRKHITVNIYSKSPTARTHHLWNYTIKPIIKKLIRHKSLNTKG